MGVSHCFHYNKIPDSYNKAIISRHTKIANFNRSINRLAKSLKPTNANYSCAITNKQINVIIKWIYLENILTSVSSDILGSGSPVYNDSTGETVFTCRELSRTYRLWYRINITIVPDTGPTILPLYQTQSRLCYHRTRHRADYVTIVPDTGPTILPLYQT